MIGQSHMECLFLCIPGGLVLVSRGRVCSIRPDLREMLRVQSGGKEQSGLYHAFV